MQLMKKHDFLSFIFKKRRDPFFDQ